MQKIENKINSFLNETFIETKWQKELKIYRRAKNVGYEGKIQVMRYRKKKPLSANGKI